MTDWILPSEKINELQQASIAALVKRAKWAHMVDVKVRINGQDEWYQVDWFKHLKPLAAPQQTAEPCIGNDPSCPCQDDDLCHYRDSPDGKTKAMPIPQQKAEPVAFHDTGANGEPVYRPQPHLTTEQVKRIKRLASLLETQVRSVYLLGDNAAERKEMVADVLETRADLYAALDALVTKE